MMIALRSPCLPVIFLAAALSACSGEQQAELPEVDQVPAETNIVSNSTGAENGSDAATSEVAPASYMICKACHTVDPGMHRIGPSLYAIYGSKAGTVTGYAFSPALRDSGLTWDDATLDKWLESPSKMVPGNKMIYAGERNPAKRKEIIEYLKTLK